MVYFIFPRVCDFNVLIDVYHQEPYKSKRSIDLNDIYHYTAHQHRLPDKIIPNSYYLEIEPLFYECKFKGRVKINLTCMETLDSIKVNAHPDILLTDDIKIRQLKSDEK